MATPKFQHSIQLPEDLEETWRRYQESQSTPESFNAFAIRLIRQEFDLLCVNTAR